MNKLAEYLRKVRVKQNLSQGDVGNVFQYGNAQYISNWERGVSKPPLKNIPALSELYKITPGELFNKILEQELSDVRSSLEKRYDKIHSR